MILIAILGILGMFGLCLLSFSWMEAMADKYQAVSCGYEPEFGSIDWTRRDAQRRGLVLHEDAYLNGREIYTEAAYVTALTYEELQETDVQTVLRATNNYIEV